MKKISVIIPHYNTPDMLARLLESIKPIEKFQIIVVDDHSNKNMHIYGKCKKTYSEKGVIFIENNGNKGAGVCRNIGLEYATCEWILFADADDYFLDSLYDKVSPYLLKSIDIVFFRTDSEDLIHQKKATRHVLYCRLVDKFLKQDSVKNEVCLRYKFGPPWGKMVRRSLIEENNIRFDEIPVSNDIMFSVKCGYYAKKIDASSESVYMIVRMQGTLTQTREDNLMKIRIDTTLDKYQFLKEHLPYKEWKYLHLCRLMFLYNSYKNHYSKEVKKYLKKRMREENIPLIQ